MDVMKLALGKKDFRRFWSKVEIFDPAGCWPWMAARKDGYGAFSTRTSKVGRAHLISYQQLVGRVPDGLELDHLCRNRACVNPLHLEPVTHRVNARRGDAGAYLKIRDRCVHGHEYTEENTYSRAGGRRECRACIYERNRKYRARKKAAQQ